MRATVTLAFILAVCLVAVTPGAAPAAEKSREAAMWYSILHPGLGEWYLRDWGSFGRNCPQKKFWLGFIPVFGWPGYLQVVSAIDARHGRTDDNLGAGPD